MQSVTRGHVFMQPNEVGIKVVVLTYELKSGARE